MNRYVLPLNAAPTEVLSWAFDTFGRRVEICTSFQLEGMAILDMTIRELGIEPRVFTLDTGRLPEETYRMIDTVREYYGVTVELIHPDPEETESMTALHGEDLFYRDVQSRMLCCHIRKVRPLERKLSTVDAWITGLRRSQGQNRSEVPLVDASASPVKIAPLAAWSRQQVEEYARENNIPVHPLYRRGYASIGCGPCTRAIEPGEPERAGRWWWEDGAVKECGIHFSPTGVVRSRRPEAQLDVMIDEILGAART